MFNVARFSSVIRLFCILLASLVNESSLLNETNLYNPRLNECSALIILSSDLPSFGISGVNHLNASTLQQSLCRTAVAVHPKQNNNNQSTELLTLNQRSVCCCLFVYTKYVLTTNIYWLTEHSAGGWKGFPLHVHLFLIQVKPPNSPRALETSTQQISEVINCIINARGLEFFSHSARANLCKQPSVMGCIVCCPAIYLVSQLQRQPAPDWPVSLRGL